MGWGTEVIDTGVVGHIRIVNPDAYLISECGICLAQLPSHTVSDTKFITDKRDSDIAISMNGLSSNTTYYIRGYIVTDKAIIYGDEITFTTATAISLPEVITLNIKDITHISASCGGTVTGNGGTEIIECGICWSNQDIPTYDDFKLISSVNDSYTLTLQGLTPETTYKVRAFARNKKGVAYGGVESFTTSRNIALPQLITLPVSEITSAGALCKGRISNNGGASVTECGVCWSYTTSNPTYSNEHISAGKLDIGEFRLVIERLLSSTRYYARAYAKNDKGINYGNVVEFTTLPLIPNIQTYSPGNITSSSIRVNGYISDDGGETALRGICWGTGRNPDITGNKTIEGSGSGSFSSHLDGLNSATTYYFRAYATNRKGNTYYGNEVFAKTKALLPVINMSMEKFTGIDALCNANISGNGGSVVTSRGFCWSIVPNSTTNDRRILCGSGNGLFTGSIGALKPETTYYVRAFASNDAGTAYSNEVVLTTQKNPLFINIYKGSAPSGDVWLTLHFSYTGPFKVKSAGLIYGVDKNAVSQGKGTDRGVTIGKEAVIKIGLNKYYYIVGYAVLSDNTVLYSKVVSEYLSWYSH